MGVHTAASHIGRVSHYDVILRAQIVGHAQHLLHTFVCVAQEEITAHVLGLNYLAHLGRVFQAGLDQRTEIVCFLELGQRFVHFVRKQVAPDDFNIFIKLAGLKDNWLQHAYVGCYPVPDEPRLLASGLHHQRKCGECSSTLVDLNPVEVLRQNLLGDL